MLVRTNQPSRFFLGISLLCLFYLGFEWFFNTYAMFSVDEFWFAHRTYEYKDSLPYRDFSPYKTVLGYYLLLLPLLLSDNIITAMIVVKNTLALANTAILLGSSLWLKRYFSSLAILSSLALLISSEIMLSYSTNIRVDLIGYWFCFFSLLCLLEKRFWVAGLLLGLGFISTQKSLWYVVASNAALGVQWLLFERHWKMVWNIARVNLALSALIITYVIFWSFLSDANTVITSVFYEAQAMYQLDWYDSARQLFWSAITLYNPLLFLLWPLTLISLLVTYQGDTHYARRCFILVYAFTVLSLLLPYKQVFPYYMQVSIPVFFMLYTAFADWLFDLFKSSVPPKLLLSKSSLWAALLFYQALVISTIIQFNLPEGYLIICLIPLLLGVYITNNASMRDLSSLFLNLILIAMMFVGGIYPLTLFLTKMININGAYQKAHIRTMNNLLQDGSDYVAGIELIYNKTQPIPGMRHLMGPAISYLYHPSDKLRKVMLASLYEDPNATVDTVIAALRQSSVKFYVNNYRMMALPESIKAYLASHYEHWWGSIYLYAPAIPQGKQSFDLKFSGNYRIESNDRGEIRLNGKRLLTQSVLHLNKGKYESKANFAYRLKLMPDEPNSLSHPAFSEDEADKVIF
jgi:hypothetical protein